MENNLVPDRPALPEFAEGETKKMELAWSVKDGTVQVEVAAEGFEDDLNQMATMLAFTLEKFLDVGDLKPE